MINRNRRGILICAVGIPLCIAVILAAISIGTHPIHPSTTARILWHYSLAALGIASDLSTSTDWSPQEAAIVWQVRARACWSAPLSEPGWPLLEP